MKNKTRLLLLAAALAAVQTQAQSFTYTEGDLLLDFRTANASKPDLTIDLGPVTAYEGATAPISLNQFSTYLTATYGANLSGLDWSVAGEDSSYNLWNTRTRNPLSPNYNNPSLSGSTAWSRYSSTIQANTRVQILGTGAAAATPGQGTVLANQVATTPGSGNTYDYAYFVGSGGNWNGKFLGGDVESATGASFTGSAFQREDLYSEPTGSGPGTYLGYFELDANAGLEFVSAAVPVPEPMTYGLLSGLGILAVSLRQQIRRFRS